MIPFFLFCMATIGLTAILVDGKIFQPLHDRLHRAVDVAVQKREQFAAQRKPLSRQWSEFFLGIITCYQCCGFWSGLFCGLFLVLSLGSFPEIRSIQELLCYFQAAFLFLICGFVGSFLGSIYAMFMELIELIVATTMLCRRTNPEPHDDHENEVHEEH